MFYIDIFTLSNIILLWSRHGQIITWNRFLWDVTTHPWPHFNCILSKWLLMSGHWWAIKSNRWIHLSITITQCLFNPLRAKFFRGNISIYLHFVSFLHIDTTLVVDILPQIRLPTYFIWSIYRGCWCPGDVRSQGISSHDIDLVKQR